MSEMIDVCMNKLMDELRAEDFLNGLDKEETIKRLAYYMGEMNFLK